MKKNIALVLVLVFVISLTACSNNSSSLSDDGITFEYFYRGFTPITEVTDVDAFNSVLGIRVILTEDDWQDFTQKFCPTAGVFASPDFSKECLVAVSSMYGSRASENASSNIERIVVNNGDFLIASGDDVSERVYAINMNGVGHWFVNVIKVSKNDIPSNIDAAGIYTSS